MNTVSTPPSPYWLKAVRTKAKLSQAKFAERLGISTRQVINLEQGRSAISPPLAILARQIEAETDRPHTNDILIF